MRFDSPLRYPGGKAPLAPLLTQIIEFNGLSGCSYLEPFAGGAGAALRLLREGTASEIHLNDLDPHLFAFWHAALYESERFAEAIMCVPLTIAEWRRQQQICSLAEASRSFELGFATFYMNRCNRSGIIQGSAPIGGYAQSGKWTMNARFYRDTLAKRILAIGQRQGQIHISNMDALDFLAARLPCFDRTVPSFVYLDPPYYEKGNRLYMNAYSDDNHRDLANFIREQEGIQWIMSYDDSDYIRDLYSNCNTMSLSLKYSLQRRRQARELLIWPSHLLQNDAEN